MKKLSLLIIAILFFAKISNASHLSGAEISYTHINGLDYKIKLKLYRDCTHGTALLSSQESIEAKSFNTTIFFNVDTIFHSR